MERNRQISKEIKGNGRSNGMRGKKATMKVGTKEEKEKEEQ